MRVRSETRSGARAGIGRLVRGMTGVVVAFALAGCSSSSKAAPKNATATTLPAASTQATATSLPSGTALTTTAPPVDRRIEVYGNCTTPGVEPTEIVLACADYNTVLEALHWTSWTITSATAVGTLVYNDCTPDCADGHFHHVPGTQVTLTVPARSVGGQLVWSEVQENPEPPGYETGPYHGGPQPLPHGPI